MCPRPFPMRSPPLLLSQLQLRLPLLPISKAQLSRSTSPSKCWTREHSSTKECQSHSSSITFRGSHTGSYGMMLLKIGYEEGCDARWSDYMRNIGSRRRSRCTRPAAAKRPY
eukprot:1969043-Rhodomonas_salina.2